LTEFIGFVVTDGFRWARKGSKLKGERQFPDVYFAKSAATKACNSMNYDRTKYHPERPLAIILEARIVVDGPLPNQNGALHCKGRGSNLEQLELPGTT
jgi:hypothetical protein